MVEIELGVLSRQCLDRCIPIREQLTQEAAAGQRRRNAERARENWQFTTADARVKFKRLYPITEPTNPTSSPTN